MNSSDIFKKSGCNSWWSVSIKAFACAVAAFVGAGTFEVLAFFVRDPGPPVEAVLVAAAAVLVLRALPLRLLVRYNRQKKIDY